jgi:hypothetical protein
LVYKLARALCTCVLKRGLDSWLLCRKGAADLLEENSYEQLQRLNITKDNTGITGAAALEGEKTSAQRRPRGRKGMEGMLVQQDKSFITKLQDFYVACLKVSFLAITSYPGG